MLGLDDGLHWFRFTFALAGWLFGVYRSLIKFVMLFISHAICVFTPNLSSFLAAILRYPNLLQAPADTLYFHTAREELH